MRLISQWIVCTALFAGSPVLAQTAPVPTPTPSTTQEFEKADQDRMAAERAEADRRELQDRHDNEFADETAFAKGIFGDATAAKAHFACYVRVYDAAHLKAHPIQKVTDIRIIVSARPLTAAQKKGTDEAPAEDTLWRWRYSVHSVLRSGAVRDRATTTPCYPTMDATGLRQMRCNAACDSGDDIRLKDGGRAITFGIAGEDLADKKYDVHDDKANPVDDNYFRLASAPMAQCAFKP